jgi:hypothetical protein
MSRTQITAAMSVSFPSLRNDFVRQPSAFEESRVADDYPNAIARFAEMQRYSFEELSQRPEYNPARKSIVSVFQPKSGGTFLHNRMLQLGHQEFWWLFANRADASKCFASSEALKLYLRGGCTCHTHARPDPNILAALDEANVDKIWVHLRNPAESAVSCYYHYQGEGHGSGDVGDLRRQQALDEAGRRGLMPDMDLSAFVRGAIDFFVKWVAEWLRFAESHPGLVVFSFYRELVNPEALLANVFDQFDTTCDRPIMNGPIPNDRYRKKRTSNWRTDLAPDVITYVERRVRAEFENLSQFDDLWS